MIYSGKQAIEFLSAKENQEESKAPSHWLYYHRDFEVLEDGSIIGIKGFGGCQPPYRGLKSVAHRLLQHKFRRIARNYKSFEDLDEMARLITVLHALTTFLPFIRWTRETPTSENVVVT